MGAAVAVSASSKRARFFDRASWTMRLRAARTRWARCCSCSCCSCCCSCCSFSVVVVVVVAAPSAAVQRRVKMVCQRAARVGLDWKSWWI